MSLSVSVLGNEAWLDPRELTPNPWNPNRQDAFMYGKELASVRKFGMVNPIIVRKTPHGHQIIDGEHRVKAALEIGLPMVPVWNLGTVDDAVAKQLTIVLNETKGSADRERLSALLSDLLTSETTSDLLDVMPYPPEDFKAILHLPDFDWDSLEAMRKPEPAYHNESRVGWVERTYRLPGDAAKVIDEAIEKAKDGDELKDWQALERVAADYLAG